MPKITEEDIKFLSKLMTKGYYLHLESIIKSIRAKSNKHPARIELIMPEEVINKSTDELRNWKGYVLFIPRKVFKEELKKEKELKP